MFYKSVFKNGSSALTTSITASGAWTYSDLISISNKIYDGKPINLALSVSSPGVTPYLHLSCLMAPTPAATYRVMGSNTGTSTIFRNTSTGSPQGDGKYYVPILLYHGGASLQLTTPGHIKLGYRSIRGAVAPVTFTAQFVIG